MSDLLEKIVELSDVYTPYKDALVIEFLSPEKTKGGVILPDSERQKLENKVLGWKVLAVGSDIIDYKKGDYVVVNFQDARPVRVPVIYKADDEIQHIQVKLYEILGKVDTNYIIAKAASDTIVN